MAQSFWYMCIWVRVSQKELQKPICLCYGFEMICLGMSPRRGKRGGEGGTLSLGIGRGGRYWACIAGLNSRRKRLCIAWCSCLSLILDFLRCVIHLSLCLFCMYRKAV